MTLRAYAPASIGNFAAGFDVLGAALAPSDGSLWGDIVEADESSGPSVELTVQGPYASALPQRADDNLVVVCYELFREQMRLQGMSVPSVRLTLTKNLPLCSGLGSSSSSSVATLVALDGLLGNPLDRQVLLELAAKAEGRFSGASHYDNVAPCLMGGLRLITGGIFPTVVPSLSLSEELPFFDHWFIAVVHPDLSVPTEKARAVIPLLVPMKAAVHYWGNLAALVHALHSRNEALAAMAIRDLLIEGYRQDLVPGFLEAKRGALDAGAVGCSLSGSGPSVFAVAENETLARAALCGMQSAFDKRGTSSQGKICQLDTQGARILEANDATK